jgi:hypothetical protein
VVTRVVEEAKEEAEGITTTKRNLLILATVSVKATKVLPKL